MIGKLVEHIDKVPFVKSLGQEISQYEHIIVDMFVSNTCNLHCRHCYFLDYKPNSKPLSLQEWYDIIDDSIALGIRHFHFSGKEPFCDQHIPLILDRLNQLSQTYELRYGLVTNGTMLNEKYLQKIVDSKLSYIEFSLEGDMVYNHEVRGVNSFESIYNMIKETPDKTKINITSTFFGNNLQVLEKMIGMFVEIGVRKFNIAPYLEFDKKQLLPIQELHYNKMIDLIRHFRHYLEEVKGKSIDIRICVSRRQAFDMFMNENELTNDINQYIYYRKKIIYELTDNILEVNFPLLYIPYLTQIIVTNDGVVIPCADDIHYQNLSEISIGKIGNDTMETILNKRKEFIFTYINQKFNKNEKD